MWSGVLSSAPKAEHESVSGEKRCDRPSQSSLLSRRSTVASTLVLGHYRVPRAVSIRLSVGAGQGKLVRVA